MRGLPDIFECHKLQSLNKALDLHIEFKFYERDFYFLNRSKNCMVATYDFGSVYILLKCDVRHRLRCLLLKYFPSALPMYTVLRFY